MADVLVIGGGPAGLSTALFTAKNALETTVFDTDETWMHKAHLFNYPGIGSIDGTNYMATLRDQVDDFGECCFLLPFRYSSNSCSIFF